MGPVFRGTAWIVGAPAWPPLGREPGAALFLRHAIHQTPVIPAQSLPGTPLTPPLRPGLRKEGATAAKKVSGSHSYRDMRRPCLLEEPVNAHC
ncbi:unnamed protein product [Arctogadus glacialis]